MDAKPYRPLRSMRTFNDENILPDGSLSKTIHQRNKSSPALSSLANGMSLKAAAKRTAFGDVSNTVSTTRTTKEEVYPSKAPFQVTSKLGHTIHERKSAALLRPAQRPLSVSGLKNLLTGSHNNNNNNNVTVDGQQRVPLNDAPSSSQQYPPSRKTITRRNTTIFRDASLDTVPEVVDSDPQKNSVILPEIVPEESYTSEVIDVQTDPQLHLPPPSTIQTVEPVKSPRQAISQHQTIESGTSFDSGTTISDEVDHHAQIKAEVSYEPQVLETLPQENPELYHNTVPPHDLPVTTAIKKVESILSLPPIKQVIEPQVVVPQEQIIPALTRPEPEEYWEEDEEGYEEEGYVTARSFRSKSDNTTGGLTTMLAPRINQQVRREIEAATKLVEATRTTEEIEDESFDTSMVAEYGDEIFEYMRHLEVKMSPNPHYMDNQHEIQWSMRSVLMDWLVQVHHRFNLLPETLFLCVNYIDRFLSSKVVSLGKLQLVGATAIFIAAKYEEINCPSVQEIVYMVDGGYSVDEILKAERFMLTMLQFELGWPGPMSFLRRISKADDYDLETRTLAKYFLEVTLMDERFIGSPPSFTAAASHCLARMMLRKGSWGAHHVYYSGYTFSQLKPLVQLLLDCCEDPAKHHRAVYEKYCDKRYKRASAFVQTEVSRGFRVPDSPIIRAYPQSPSYAYHANSSYFGA